MRQIIATAVPCFICLPYAILYRAARKAAVIINLSVFLVQHFRWEKIQQTKLASILLQLKGVKNLSSQPAVSGFPLDTSLYFLFG